MANAKLFKEIKEELGNPTFRTHAEEKAVLIRQYEMKISQVLNSGEAIDVETMRW